MFADNSFLSKTEPVIVVARFIENPALAVIEHQGKRRLQICPST
jgi:hypothetical protein